MQFHRFLHHPTYSTGFSQHPSPYSYKNHLKPFNIPSKSSDQLLTLLQYIDMGGKGGGSGGGKGGGGAGSAKGGGGGGGKGNSSGGGKTTSSGGGAMMKAPGGVGYISRAGFESNPQGYFHGLHHGGGQQAGPNDDC